MSGVAKATRGLTPKPGPPGDPLGGAPPPRPAGPAVLHERPAGPREAASPILWEAVRRRWHLLVVALVLGAAVGYGFSSARPAIYEATATVLFHDPSAVGEGSALRPDVAASIVALRAERGDTPAVHREAGLLLGIAPEAVAEAITARGSVEAFGMDIVAEAGSPVDAASIANAVADTYVELEQERAEAAVRETRSALERRLGVVGERIEETVGVLESSPSDRLAAQRLGGLSAQQLDLQARLDELDVSSDPAAGGVVEVVLAATVPAAPVAPQPLRDAGIVAVAAALALTALLWFRVIRPPAAQSTAGAGAALAMPLLARVRAGRTDRRGNDGHSDEGPDDALRLVSTAIRRELGGGPGIVLISGVGPRRARSRIVEQTAVIARSETDVDLVLLRVEVPERQRWWRGRPAPDEDVGSAPEGGIDVRTTTEPMWELARQRWGGALVLIDAPDASSPEFTNLALACDCIVLVVSSGESASELLDLRRLLDLTAAPVLGYVHSDGSG